MGSWCKAVAFLLAITAVLSTPLVNDLQPNQEWPGRQSVKQPSEIQDVALPERITDSLLVEKNKADEEKAESLGEEVLIPETNDDDAPFKPSDSENKDVILEQSDVNVINKDETINQVAEPTLKVASTAKADSEPEKVDYTGSQLWKISMTKNGTRSVISRLRRRNLITTWGTNGTAIDVLIKANAIQNVTRILEREKIIFEVVIEDLQQRINEENPPLDENEVELQDRRGHRMNWKQYHRLEDIHGFLDYLAKTYPAVISVNTIGKSYEGRELKVLRISNGNSSNKAVFIDGGIHAREWISPATVTYLINQFAENFDEESEDVKNIDWYFLPVVNPDGYEFTHMGDRLWRKNRRPGVGSRGCSGVDLNRNFGYRWGGKGTSSNSCSEIYRGPRAFSEPESLAVQEFFKTNAAKFKAYISYHSYGQYILYPWGYDNAVPPDHQDLNALGNKMAAAIEATGGDRYRVGSSSNMLYPAAGGSDDWAKSRGVKYAYTIELNDMGRYGFILPTTYIEHVAKESLAALRVLAAEINKG